MTAQQYAEAKKALDKAVFTLQNAEHDLAGGFYLATANRAYYTCFYCMTALLYTEGLFAKTHQGLRSKFSEVFIKTERFPVASSDMIALLIESRQEADYDLDANITAAEAKDLIGNAAEFLSLAQACFEGLKENGV